MVTISTHNGSTVHQAHNIRAEKVVTKEAHIDPNGVHETWVHEPVREAYHRLFDEAVARYNAGQTREERKIDDYYNKVEKNVKQHPAYEMIIGVYGQDCPKDLGKVIMQEFVQEWQERNPNLALIGAYYHADEQGEPHVHIDYVPVAHGYTKGMDTQAGLVKAFGEMGFEKQGKATAQIQWEHRENEALTHICERYGLEVSHPKEEGRIHLATEAYKAEQKIEAMNNEIEDLKAIKEMDEGIVRGLDKKIEDKEHYRDDLEAHIGSLQVKASKTSTLLKEAQEELKTKQSVIETMNDALANLFTRFNTAYNQMQKIFEHWLKNDQKIYTELVAKADKPITQGNKAMENLLSKSNIIFGKATQEALAQVREESNKLKEATEELEDLEEEYDDFER